MMALVLYIYYENIVYYIYLFFSISHITLLCLSYWYRMLFPKLSRVHAAQACATEQSSGPVLACLREVNKGISASSVGAYVATPETVVAVCSAAGTAVAEAATSGKDKQSRTGACGYTPPVIQGTPGVRQGVCLAKLASTPTSRLIFDAAVPAHLCALPQYESILVCLDKQNKRMVTVDDVTVCVNTKQQVKTMRVKRILTEDNDIQITAGTTMLILLLLLYGIYNYICIINFYSK